MESTVLAAAMTRPGKPGRVEVVHLPRPRPGAGEVLLRVAFASLNRTDLFTLDGGPPSEAALPHVLGADASGTIDEVGPGVTGWRVGDTVVVNPGISCGTCAACRGAEESQCETLGVRGDESPGTMAEAIVVPASSLARVPASRLQAAAAGVLAGMTAWRMAVARGRLALGETCWIPAATGGVGTMLIQVAKLRGATVIASTRDASRADALKRLGVDHVLTGPVERLGPQLLGLTGNRGVDLVLDTAGRDTVGVALASVRRGGRIVTSGRTSGQDLALDLKPFFWREIELLGSSLGNRHDFAQAVKLLAEGALEPPVFRVFPLREAPAAFELLRSGALVGKVLLRM